MFRQVGLFGESSADTKFKVNQREKLSEIDVMWRPNRRCLHQIYIASRLGQLLRTKKEKNGNENVYKMKQNGINCD